MRRASVSGLLLSALLATLAVGPTAGADSRAGEPATRSTVSARLAPGRVTFFGNGAVEPTGVVAQVEPAKAGRRITFQQRVGGAWSTVGTATSDARGRAFLPVSVTGTGRRQYRTIVARSSRFTGATSRTARLSITPNSGCRPTAALVDRAATGEAQCLARRLDTWRSAGVMGVGQQLNVSNRDYLAPLGGIGRVSVVGFDLEELAKGETFSFTRPPLTTLIDLAHDGAVLSASWHADNPFTGGPSTDTSRGDLAQLLTRDPDHPEAYDTFWRDWSEKLELLRRLQVGDGDGDGLSDDDPCRCTPVVLRPLHEANGRFFWWGRPDPATYRKIWRMMQDRAWAAGVHNIVWAFSANRDTEGVDNPAKYLPARVDVGGLDTYDPETGRGNAADRLGLEGYAALAQRVPRMALTEVGPHASRSGQWNPAVISRTLVAERSRPLWAMLWFDDTGYPGAGRKQITSLSGGRAWLRSCVNALCYLR